MQTTHCITNYHRLRVKIQLVLPLLTVCKSGGNDGDVAEKVFPILQTVCDKLRISLKTSLRSPTPETSNNKLTISWKTFLISPTPDICSCEFCNAEMFTCGDLTNEVVGQVGTGV